MRGARTTIIAVLLLGVAGIAAAGQMTLTRSGDLYRVDKVDGALMVTSVYADGTTEELMVPQSGAAVPDSLQVGVDEASGTLYVLWQKNKRINPKVRLAAYREGTWFGPRTIAGNDGTIAFNPQMLLHRAKTTITEEQEDGVEPIEIELATSFVLLTWWSQVSEEDPGVARYASIPIREDGLPAFDSMDSEILSDLLPYGYACFDLEATDNLKHPKLFLDPRSGNPHVFATDLEFCVFQILELRPEVETIDDGFDKRRRHVVVLRSGAMIALRRDLPLAFAKLEVGGDLSLIMHWDGIEGLLHYIELDREGISEPKSLILGPTLSHEQAVDLVRGLTR
jgi:hypothetical protein